MADKIAISKKQRLEYLIITACVFLSSFIIYGSIGGFTRFLSGNSIKDFLGFGSIGGFTFSSIVSAIILSTRFFQRKGLAFKIVAAVLWPITFACCFYVGVLMHLPYGIYNIVMLIKKEPQVIEPIDNTTNMQP